MTVTLAQLMDIMSDSAWNVVIFGGLAAPAVGTILSRLVWRRPITWRWSLLFVFYLFALPMALFVFGPGVNVSEIFACSYLALMPVGFILGIIMLFPPSLPNVADGKCRKCGYDLRATPDRCPECGTIASTGARR